jgi:iron complex outermembrane receptor protein
MFRSHQAAAICSAALVTLIAKAACAADAAEPADSAPDALQEVTITAEKQTQSLQKTAAAVTAIQADDLVDAGVVDLREAQKLVPSVRFQAEGNNTQVLVRGVGSVLDQANVEPNVAFNLAGIYVPRESTSAAFFDLEQFEVLPGPQGTLYGRSAIGGTINLTPTRPAFNNEGSALVEAGNYSAVHATVTQNFEAKDNLALRAAIDYNKNDGVMRTGSDSKDDLGVRLSALYDATDNLSAYLWVQGAKKNGHTANLVNKGTDPVTGAYCEKCFLHSDPWDDTRTGQFAAPFGEPKAEDNDYESLVLGGQIDYKLSGATLSYLPSYLYLDTVPVYWLSAIQSRNTAHYNQITHELRLSSDSSGPLRWLGGIYFYYVRNNGALSLFTNQPFEFAQDSVNDGRLKGYAAFGQATYSLTDTLRITGGARASTTKRDAVGTEPVALGGLPYEFHKSYDNIDWKIGLEKDLMPAFMVYGNVQTGYQPGTFNELPNTATFDNEVKASRLRAYTAGFKSRWFDNRLQINNEIYYYDYRDLLIQSYNISAAYNLIFNAKKVAIKGDQLDLLAKVFTNDEINLNVGYSRARNEDFITPDGSNYNGYSLAYAPDWTVMGGYTHNMPIGAANLRAHLDWRYESSWYGDYVHNSGTRQAPSNKGDASLMYERVNWSAGAWIKNIQNKIVIAATAAAGIPGPATSYLDQPRTYGVRFQMNY